MVSNQSPSLELSCWNEDCPGYGQVNRGNIHKFGQTRRGTQRYQCKTCKHTFVATRGTIFYGRHHSEETILKCLAMLATGKSWAEVERSQGIQRGTVLKWVRGAALQADRVEVLLQDKCHLNRIQLDTLWSYTDRGKMEKEDQVGQV